MRRLAMTVITSAFLLMSMVAQADTVTLSSAIPFAADSGASENVRKECKFETRLPEYIRKQAKRGLKVVVTEEPLEDVQGKALFLEIANVHAPGGGGYSGSKSAIVKGELKESGEVIASVTARRRTLVGMTPGTCSMLKRIAKKLGEDLADWLREPTMNARLGDIKDE